jgi:carboxyl-terminal processing protease
MKASPKLLIIAATLAFVLAACGGAPEPSATPAATHTPTTEPTATRVPTKTPPQTGPLATAAALSAQVTLNPPTPVGGVEVQGPDDYVGLFQQAWNVIRDNYVRDSFNGLDWDAVYDEYLPQFEAVTSQEEHWALMTDFVHVLNDDHSRFVPPERMEAEFGVETAASSEPVPWSGAYVWPAKEDEQLMIWCASGPAAAAGLRRGDVITRVDGKEIVKSDADWESDDYREVLYGDQESGEVTLTVIQGPGAEPRDITLQLALGHGCEGWSHGIVNSSPRIGYVRVPDYDGDAATNILSAIHDMETDAPLDGLIVDQRHNPGGNPNESVAIFAEGTVGTVGPFRQDKQRTIYRIRGPITWNETTPVVVLSDGNSHSAADYFPAAMQELGRATILGMPSAGNTEGIVSFNLADGTLIRLAVSTLALNDGSILEGTGVQPDVMVPLGEWGLRQTPYDVQLQAAIEFLGG